MRGREESAGSAREEESAGGARGADQSAGAQEAPELRRSEREVSAQEEQAEQEREAEAQGGHESEVKAQEGHKGKVKAQGEQGEDANSVHEESHVSDRHMTWWQNAWWVRVNNGPHLRTARDGEQPQEPRRKCVRQERSPGRKREMGDGKQRKQRLARRPSLSCCKHCNSKTSSSNSSSDGAPAVIHQTEFAEKATVEPPATADLS